MEVLLFQFQANMKKLIIIFLLLLIVAGCATHYTSATYFEPYGFLLGIWHGFIVVFVAIGKLLSWFLSFFDLNVLEEIKFIGRPNTGISYFVGYIIGILLFSSSASG